MNNKHTKREDIVKALKYSLYIMDFILDWEGYKYWEQEQYDFIKKVYEDVINEKRKR